MIAVAILFIYAYATEYRQFPNGEDFIFHTGGWEWEFSPIHMALVFVCIRTFWLMDYYLWKPLNQAMGWLLIPLGQASLFTFMLHLALIPIFWNIPEVFEDLDLLTATFWNAVLIAVLFSAVTIRAWVLEVPAKCNLLFERII